MSRAIWVTILSCVLLIISQFISSSDDIVNDRRVFKEEGIGSALNMYFMSRAYPNATIDAGKISTEFDRHLDFTSQRNSIAEPWELMGPENFAGRILCLAFNTQNNNTLFAGSASGGLWRSYSTGEGVDAWDQVSLPIGTLSIGSIAIHPSDSNIIIIGTGEVYNYEYVGTGEHVWMTRGIPGTGIYKTTNYGNSWEQVVDHNLSSLLSFNMIKYDPNNSDVLYAAGTDGLYKSTNGGDDWNLIESAINVTDLIINESNSDHVVFSCGNLGSPGGGVYKSTDGGDSFSLVSSSFPSFNGKIMLAMSPDDPNLIAASVGYPSQEKEMFISSDFGDNWDDQNIEFTYGWYAHDLVFEPGNTDRLICAGVDIYRYTRSNTNLNKRSDWTEWFDYPEIDGPAGPSDYVHGDIHDIQYLPGSQNVVYFATDGGVFKSTNDAGTFSSLNSGLVTTQFYSGMSSSQQDENVFFGGLQDNGTVKYYGDGKWKRVLGGDGSYCGVNPDNDNYVFGSTYNLIMYRSTDGGEDFDYINDIPYHTDENSAFISPFEIAPGDPSVIYGASDRLFRSINNGASWNETSGGEFDNGKTATDIAVSYTNSNKLFVATCPLRQIDIGQYTYTDRSRIFRTINGGNSYSDVTSNIPDRFVTDIDVLSSEDDIIYATLGGYGTDHVFISPDGGITWNSLDNGQLPDVPFNSVCIDPFNNDIIYVGCDFGMYYSIDGGVNWTVMSDGLPENVIVMDISSQESEKKLRIGTHGNGAYQTTLLSELIISGIKEESVEVVEIYPNPCKESFKLRGNVEQVEILDMMGRIVKNYPKQSEYNVSSLASGTYLIRINNNQTISNLTIE